MFGEGNDAADFSSTKSLTGHSLGATGVQEAIYCLLMMQDNFICRLGQYRPTGPGDRPERDRHEAHRQVPASTR